MPYWLVGWLVFVHLSHVVHCQDVTEDCWESCFLQPGAYQSEYYSLYSLVEDVRMARIEAGANGTAFLLDGAVSEMAGMTAATADAILEYQKQLAQLLVITAPTLTKNNPFYATMYDTSSSW